MKPQKSESSPVALLLPEQNRLPDNISHVHLMGICGTGMASLAGLLKHLGLRVTGSDQNVYPPMSDFLKTLSIPVREGYGPKNLDPPPDLVIVGNVITRKNPEAVALSGLGTPYLSMPQALRHFAMKGKKSIVVCGTHGKTTTSALAAWVLESAGSDVDFMIGGIPLNFGRNFKQGAGPYFVVEGDEYDTAFFDKGPKFLHYNPWTVILTSIEFDHADIYRDLDHIRRSFQKLIDLIPSDGMLIVHGDEALTRSESAKARCPVVTYGFSENNDWQILRVNTTTETTRLSVRNAHGTMTVETPLYGRHNLLNLLAVIALSHSLDIGPQTLTDALIHFRGVRRRQEIRGEKRGILVVDDFAHHPTSVRETVAAVKEKYANRRLIAVFEPRSNSSRRNTFQKAYALAFEQADRVLIPEPPMMDKIPPSKRFSSARLVEDLNRQHEKAEYCPDNNRLLDRLLAVSCQGDVILIMSNGSFDNLVERLLAAL